MTTATEKPNAPAGGQTVQPTPQVRDIKSVGNVGRSPNWGARLLIAGAAVIVTGAACAEDADPCAGIGKLNSRTSNLPLSVEAIGAGETRKIGGEEYRVQVIEVGDGESTLWLVDSRGRPISSISDPRDGTLSQRANLGDGDEASATLPDDTPVSVKLCAEAVTADGTPKALLGSFEWDQCTTVDREVPGPAPHTVTHTDGVRQTVTTFVKETGETPDRSDATCQTITRTDSREISTFSPAIMQTVQPFGAQIEIQGQMWERIENTATGTMWVGKRDLPATEVAANQSILSTGSDVIMNFGTPVRRASDNHYVVDCWVELGGTAGVRHVVFEQGFQVQVFTDEHGRNVAARVEVSSDGRVRVQLDDAQEIQVGSTISGQNVTAMEHNATGGVTRIELQNPTASN